MHTASGEPLNAATHPSQRESPAPTPPAPRERPIPKAHPAIFWLGIVLMALSFSVYPSYGLIAVLPLTPTGRMEVGVAAWATSWCCFALGSALAGAEGVEFLHRLFRRRATRSDPEAVE